MNTRFMKPSNYVHPSAFSRDFLVCFYHLMLVKFKKFIVKKQGAQKMNTMHLQKFFLPLVAELPCKLSALLLLKRYAVYIVLCSSQTIVNFKILYLCQAYRQVLTYIHRKNHYRPCRIKYGLNS